MRAATTLSVPETAALLARSESYVRTLIKHEQLEAVQVGGLWRVRIPSVRNHMIKSWALV